MSSSTVRAPLLPFIRRRSDSVASCTPRRPNGPDPLRSDPFRRTRPRQRDKVGRWLCRTLCHSRAHTKYTCDDTCCVRSSERAVVPSWSVRDEASQSVRAAHALAHSQAHARARTHRDAHARTRPPARPQALVDARRWQLQRARYSATSVHCTASGRMLERHLVCCTSDPLLHQRSVWCAAPAIQHCRASRTDAFDSVAILCSRSGHVVHSVLEGRRRLPRAGGPAHAAVYSRAGEPRAGVFERRCCSRLRASLG